MKLINIFFAVLFSTLVLSACDEISTPIISKTVNSSLPSSMPAFTNISDSTGTTSYKQYKMLLEVMGGHLCTNCPLGQTDAEAVLSSSIGGQVVFMQDEMGPESSTAAANIPSDAPAGSFQVDYQCAVDSTWWYIFGSPVTFPMGVVNREGAPNNMFVIYPYQDSCTTIINRASNVTPAVTIRIEDSCWTNPRIIGANFKLTFLKPLSGSYLLQTLIVEDSIIDWQVNNGAIISNFLHRNTLRGAFGNNTGGSIPGVNIPATSVGTAWTSYQTYDFTNGENGKAAHWNMAHCYIVAFVYNSPNNASPYQVVQAEMIKVE